LFSVYPNEDGVSSDCEDIVSPYLTDYPGLSAHLALYSGLEEQLYTHRSRLEIGQIELTSNTINPWKTVRLTALDAIMISHRRPVGMAIHQQNRPISANQLNVDIDRRTLENSSRFPE